MQNTNYHYTYFKHQLSSRVRKVSMELCHGFASKKHQIQSLASPKYRVEQYSDLKIKVCPQMKHVAIKETLKSPCTSRFLICEMRMITQVCYKI